MKECIICDLDGTLSLFDKDKKNPYNRDFENDECSQPVRFLLENYSKEYPESKIFFLSGRNDKAKFATLQFFMKNFSKEFILRGNYELVMRRNKDFRKDTIIKEEMYKEHIKGKYDVDFVIDDRLQVCRLWYELGLFVFNVNQGLIEF